MKKNLLFAAIFAAGAMAMSAADLPKAFSFTVTPDGDTQVAISGLTTDATENLEFQIDWGDGKLSEVYKLEDYNTTWTPTVYKSVPKGNTITIYANPDAVQYIDGSWATGDLKWESIDVTALTALKNLDVTSNAISKIDVTNNANLTKLVMIGNKLEGILDVSGCPQLSSLDFSNTVDNPSNQVTGINFGDLSVLSSLKANYNPIETLDLSQQTKLSSLYLMGTGISSLNISGCTALTYITVNDCNLANLDLSSINTTKKVTLFANNNKLSEIRIPTAMKSNSVFNIKNNRFNFATLPIIAGTVNCEDQAPIEIASEGNTINVAEFMPVIGENATIAAWYDGETELMAGTDYTEENGVFTFVKNVAAANVKLTNAAFPKLTLTSNSVIVSTSAISSIMTDDDATEYFNLQGVRISNPENGIFIVKKGKEVYKQVIK